MCMRQGAGFVNPCCFGPCTDAWVSDPSAHTAYIYILRRPVKTDFCCSVIDGKISSLASGAYYKKVT